MSYQYNCNDKSVLYPYMKKYLWGPSLRFIPMKRSANTITLISNLFSFIAFALLAVAAYTPLPREAFVIPAIAIFLYLWLDNIDGAQARRTDSSSPLGEFLDHWFDAFNIGFIVVGYGMAMDLEPWLLMMAAGLCAMAYCATMWEQRMTGWLNFGHLGSIEGILLICVMYLLTAGLGKEAITRTALIGPMTLSHIFVTMVCAGFAHTAISAVLRVRRGYAGLVPLGVGVGITSFWYAFGDIGMVPAALIVVLTGCLFGGRQIISRLFDERYRGSDWVLTTGTLLGLLGAMIGWTETAQVGLAWALVAYLGIQLFRDFVGTTRRLSQHLRPREMLSFYFFRSR